MMLYVNDICFSYNSHPVIADITFALAPGRILAVLGVNGAGKSTLLKCLNRIITPHSGTVYLSGEDLLRMSSRHIAQRLGYVPQNHSDSRLSVYETILLGRKPHMQWTISMLDYQIVERLLVQLGLSHLSEKPVNRLSGGELQKVIIGRALAQTPSVLLLDEPTSNLDLKNQMEVMKLIVSVVESEQMTAIVSIHDLNLALRFADSFLFLQDHSIHSLVKKTQLNEKMIEEVYGVKVVLQEVAGQTIVVPLDPSAPEIGKAGERM